MADISARECPRPAIILAAALALCACSPTAGLVVGQRPVPAAKADAEAHQDRSSGDIIRPGTVESGVEYSLSGNSIKGAAVYEVLNDAYVEQVRPARKGMVKNRPSEIFQSDGIYAQVSNGTRLYGSYRVQGDAVCVKGDGIESRCRHVVPKANGTYSFVDVSSRLETHIIIKPRRDVDSWDPSTKVIDYQGMKYVKVSGEDVKRALFWRELSYVPRSLLSTRYLSERFFENNLYRLTRQESPYISGKWQVIEDMVCVQEAGKIDLCRYLYTNNDWTLVLLVESSGDRRHYALRPARR